MPDKLLRVNYARGVSYKAKQLDFISKLKAQ